MTRFMYTLISSLFLPFQRQSLNRYKPTVIWNTRSLRLNGDFSIPTGTEVFCRGVRIFHLVMWRHFSCADFNALQLVSVGDISDFIVHPIFFILCCSLFRHYAKCTPETDLLTQFVVLSPWDGDCRLEVRSHPLTGYWRLANQFLRRPCNATCLTE